MHCLQSDIQQRFNNRALEGENLRNRFHHEAPTESKLKRTTLTCDTIINAFKNIILLNNIVITYLNTFITLMLTNTDY